MDAEILAIYYSCQWKAFECIKGSLVSFFIKVDEHLLPEVELVGLLKRFVVPTNEKDLVWKARLQSKQVGYALCTMLAPIDVVTQEQELFTRLTKAKLSKQLNQVVKLAVNVTKNGNFTINSDQVRLILQHILGVVKHRNESLF